MVSMIQECLDWQPLSAYLLSKDSRGQNLGEGIYMAARHGSLSTIPMLKNSSWCFKAMATGLICHSLIERLQFALFRNHIGKAVWMVVPKVKCLYGSLSVV